MTIPFNRPLITGDEQAALEQVLRGGSFSGCGDYSRRCSEFLEDMTGCLKAIMTPSCTAALELAALLCDLKPGDEVILPSFTFVTTASAFVLRGAVPVWCDIRPDTQNIDETKIEALITSRTKAVVVVHYAGVPCEMDLICRICQLHGLMLIEDAAQAIGSCYRGIPAGRFGDLAALSFHETKNIQCGEGGALLINRPELVERAQILRDKGTDRIHFNQGRVDKYSWVDLGSSFLMSELQAAFLHPQLLQCQNVNQERLTAFMRYRSGLEKELGPDRLPGLPPDVLPNGHLFYLLTRDKGQRRDLIRHLEQNGIMAVFHYLPLHQAPYWQGRYDRLSLPVSERVSDTLLRLPMFSGLQNKDIDFIVDTVLGFWS